jgi:hypothetical protein
MRIVRRTGLWALVAAWTLAAGPVHAGNNPNGIVFRAVGFAAGEAEISGGQIKCEIPDIQGAIRDGAFSFGLWNTFGVQSLTFPDVNHPFGNPCGGWLQLQSNLVEQGLSIERIEMRFAIPGAGRFRQFVPTRQRFPIACRDFRSATLYTGAVLSPSNGMNSNSSSGAPNVAFVHMLPMVTPQLLGCLRDQYAGLSTDLFVSLPLVIRATAVGRADSGEVYRANTARYTLTLRHTCGNGRVDDGEFCDPNAPNTCSGYCNAGTCTLPRGKGCTTDAECAQGTCVAPDDPSECICTY